MTMNTDEIKRVIEDSEGMSATDRDQVRREHAEWSQATFGNVGPVGPLKHLRREVLETIAKPHDLIEWADMQFLLWDAQRRAGITDEQITQAMIDKLAVNKQREWPEPKDGEPRLHIKEQPSPVAPVVPDFKKLARELVDNLVDCGGLDEGVKEKYLEWAEKTCRAAMLAACPQEVK
ncbi:Eaa1 [Klebsiella quasipneumoniae]|nr:Eaa1 [Klebsiella quasipneumoniae]